jgi:hypothetical protein
MGAFRRFHGKELGLNNSVNLDWKLLVLTTFKSLRSAIINQTVIQSSFDL